MNYCLRIFICLSFSLLASQICFGQKASDSHVTGDFRHTPLEQFLIALESQVNYRFYYDNSEFDSTVVTLSVNKQPLAEVLKLALDSTEFKF